jgi:hypothetical protein
MHIAAHRYRDLSFQIDANVTAMSVERVHLRAGRQDGKGNSVGMIVQEFAKDRN